MGITIHIPTPLRRFTSENGEVEVEGRTVGEALQDLTRRHPSLERHLFNDQGALRALWLRKISLPTPCDRNPSWVDADVGLQELRSLNRTAGQTIVMVLLVDAAS